MAPESMIQLPLLSAGEFLSMPVETLGGMPEVVRWCMTQTLMLSVEVNTDYVRKFVPPKLTPVEVRPGVSLFTLLMNEMVTGNTDLPIGRSPFLEVLNVIPVLPDLALQMPVPRFTFFATKIISDEAAFVDNERRKLLLNVHHAPTLQLERTGDYGVRLFDAEGEIFDIRPTLASMPPLEEFTWKDYWIQFYSMKEGVLHRGICSWSGPSYEIQKLGDYGALQTGHSYFSETPGLEPHLGEVYMQYFSPRQSLCLERFWGMEPIR